MLLVVSGVVSGAAFARPDKQPDNTLNDHPSGKDRTAEPGTSGTQGNSPSDPDGEANGGADKPGGDGGFDADKDGNNGCGNDDDFEDDNNGNCGGRRVQGANARGAQKADDAHKADDSQKQHRAVQGQGNEVKRLDDTAAPDGTRHPHGMPSAAVQAVEDTQVLGVSFVREPATAAAVSGSAVARTTQAAPATLAATGEPALELFAVALLLLASGAVLLVGARRRETMLA